MSKQCLYMSGCGFSNLVTTGCLNADRCKRFVSLFKDDNSSGNVFGTIQTYSAPLPSETQFQCGAECQVCGNAFTISNYYRHPEMCPECRKRLKRILYPELKES